MLNNDEHAFVLFDSLYNDFKLWYHISLNHRMNRISATSFFLQLESIAGTSIARSIFELVKLNCPIELYPEVEHFLDSTAFVFLILFVILEMIVSLKREYSMSV